MRMTIQVVIERDDEPPRERDERLSEKYFSHNIVNTFKKMIHEQLPLPVPCYDLALLTESSLGPLAWNFGYPQLAWLDGR